MGSDLISPTCYPNSGVVVTYLRALKVVGEEAEEGIL